MERGKLYDIAHLVIGNLSQEYPEIEIALFFYPVAHQPHVFFRQLSLCLKNADIQRVYRLDNIHTSAEMSEAVVRLETELLVKTYIRHFLRNMVQVN